MVEIIVRSQKDSSEKYGLCEICNQHVSEVFSASDAYAHGEQFNGPFGHKECVSRVVNKFLAKHAEGDL